MKKLGGVLSVSAAVFFINSSIANAGMVEQVLYNVVGQVSNAIGARLGDEIYYGSSSGGRVVTHTHRRVHHHPKKRKKVAKKKAAKKSSVKKIVFTEEMKIQRALKSLGFYKGPIDGEINSFETRNAIKQLNQTYGISQDAFLSPKLKDNLIYLGSLFDFDRKLIAKGTGKKTKAIKLQTALKINGFYFSKIDGLVGKGTKEAIAKYKRANNLSAGSKLDYEEEYRLISSAKELNDRNIENTINAIKALGMNNRMPKTNQVAQSVPVNQSLQQSMQPTVRQNSQLPMANRGIQNRQVAQPTAVQPVQNIQPSARGVGVVTANTQQIQAVSQPARVGNGVQQSIPQQNIQKPANQNIQPTIQQPPQPVVNMQQKKLVRVMPNTQGQTQIQKQPSQQQMQSQNIQVQNLNTVTHSVVAQSSVNAVKANGSKTENNKTVGAKANTQNNKVAQLIEEINK